MKISVCYITKNEEKNLPSSLEGIKAIADEIIIVDTGSTDKTLAIARAYGAKAYSYAWQDDFSGPRNYAIEQAAGDWIIFLDADEILKHSNRQRLMDWLRDNGKQLVLMMWMKHIDMDTGQILMENMAPRIMRNHKELRYVGKIHEQLFFQGKTVSKVGYCPISAGWLLHTGYTQSRMKKKAERNLRMLLPELELDKPSQDVYMYLAEAYDGLEDWEHAVYYARKDIEQGRRSIIYASRSWMLLLRLYAKYPEYIQERLQVVLSAVKNFPELPVFHAELAECYVSYANFAGAYRSFERALHLCENYRHGLEPQLLTLEQMKQIEQRMRAVKKQIHYPEQWDLARQQEILELHKQNRIAISKVLPELIELIIRLQQERPTAKRDETLIRLISYLPVDYEAFWQYQLGLLDVMPINMTDTYLTMLVYVLRYGDAEQWHYYTEQSLRMTADCFYKTINLLLEQERWQIAWSLLEQIPADSDWIQAEYWYAAGVCLFYRHENLLALECFSRAKNAGMQNNEMDSYIKWAGDET
ncbi:glycosyltransferase family 2 protein [Selenomonas sp. FC4001]|uniref:tetratricopeptide repeat-containing glycosyltransferase family 2 protein n=1 Tax=Selenomonas sp. FC4001 TaxID=1408313 RepID=UPI00055F7D07|nr:glycosyltransferase family 2 protein [Selenomonas sp. FC4001]